MSTTSGREPRKERVAHATDDDVTIAEWLDGLTTDGERLEFLEYVILDHTDSVGHSGVQTTMGSGCLHLIEELHLYTQPTFAAYMRERWGLVRRRDWGRVRQG